MIMLGIAIACVFLCGGLNYGVLINSDKFYKIILHSSTPQLITSYINSLLPLFDSFNFIFSPNSLLGITKFKQYIQSFYQLLQLTLWLAGEVHNFSHLPKRENSITDHSSTLKKKYVTFTALFPTIFLFPTYRPHLLC